MTLLLRMSPDAPFLSCGIDDADSEKNAFAMMVHDRMLEEVYPHPVCSMRCQISSLPLVHASLVAISPLVGSALCGAVCCTCLHEGCWLAFMRHT